MILELLRIDAVRPKHVIDQDDHALIGLVALHEKRLLFDRELSQAPRENHVERPLHPGERGAQLMRHDRNEIGFRLIKLVELLIGPRQLEIAADKHLSHVLLLGKVLL